MKIFGKRIAAFIIDLLILGCLIAILKQFVEIRKNSLEYAALFLPLFLRDLTFKGASFGKKIMGIRVYNNEWKTPSYRLVLKRTFRMTYLGFNAWFNNGAIVGEGIIEMLDLEHQKIGTRVVENEVYKKLLAEAKSLDGDFVENMNSLYDAYIKDVYSEKEKETNE